MPSIYKIGFTDRSPHARIEELSRSTSIPSPFDLICYIEVESALRVERDMHDMNVNFRVSGNREFFQVPDGEEFLKLLSSFVHHPYALSIGKGGDFEYWKCKAGETDKEIPDYYAQLKTGESM